MPLTPEDRRWSPAAKPRLICSPYVSRELRTFLQLAVRHPHLPVILVGERGTGKRLVASELFRERVMTHQSGAMRVYSCRSRERQPTPLGLPLRNWPSVVHLLKVGEGQGLLFLDGLDRLAKSRQATLASLIGEAETGAPRSSGWQVVVSLRQNIDEAVAGQSLLPDLARKLRGLTVSLPSLAEQPAHLWALVAHYARARKLGWSQREHDLIARRLTARTWPENGRSLYRYLDWLVAESRASGQKISDLVCPPAASRTRGEEAEGLAVLPRDPDEDVVARLARALALDTPLEPLLSAIEQAVIERAMMRHETNELVCKGLRLPRTSFYAKLRRYDLSRSATI